MFTITELIVLSVYITTIIVAILAIQILNPGQAIRESMKVQETNEKFVQADFEEPDSDEEPPFNPQTEEYTMEENPMLRHRNVGNQVEKETESEKESEDKESEIPWVEQVD